MRKSHLYVIGDGASVKIGVSESPTTRLRQLQTGNPRRLTVELSIPFDSHAEAYAAEKEIHAYYADERQHGEWFELSPRLREHLGQVV